MREIPDAELDRLIREALSSREGAPRPSLETVRAYVRGEATVEQTAEVRRALAASAEFREELLSISYLEEASDRFDADEEPVPTADTPARPESPRVVEFPWYRRFRAPLGFAAAAAVLLVALSVWSLSGSPPEPTGPELTASLTFDSRQTAAELRGLRDRNGGMGPDVELTTRVEAATAGMLPLLDLGADPVTLREIAAPTLRRWNETISIRFVRPDGSELAESRFAVPADASEPELVVIFVPSLEKATVELPAARTRVAIDAAKGDAMAVAVGWMVDGRPVASPPQTIRIR